MDVSLGSLFTYLMFSSPIFICFLTFYCIISCCSSLQLMVTDGAGGKGTWGKLLDTDGESHLDRNDPNYDSGEVIAVFKACILVSNIDYCPLEF